MKIVRLAWPNQLRFIRKNLLTVLFIINLNSVEQTSFVFFEITF